MRDTIAMSSGKVTRMILRDDMPASITSSQRGANLDAVAFNIEFLLRRRPSLAVEAMKLFDQARRLHAEDPKAPDEDFRSANEKWERFIKPASRN